MRERVSIGVDFGTTNTVVAIARPGAAVRAVSFRDEHETSDIYRSVLLFEKGLSATGLDLEAHAGLQAIRFYLTSTAETRFIQSFKSHVASPAFEETRIFGRRFKFEDLLAIFFRRAIADADGQIDQGAGRLGPAGRVCRRRARRSARGLPLRRGRYRRVGITAAAYVYEPVGAAYYYAQRLTSDALVLVADFGGGTSDFSLIRFERRGNRGHRDRLSVMPVWRWPATISITGSSTPSSRRISARARCSVRSTRSCRSRSTITPASRAGTSWRCSRPRSTSASLNGWNAHLAPAQIGHFLEVIRNDLGFNIPATSSLTRRRGRC